MKKKKDMKPNLQADWWSSAYGQHYGPSVHQSAEWQADLCANRQRETSQLHVTRLRETDRIQLLWEGEHHKYFSIALNYIKHIDACFYEWMALVRINHGEQRIQHTC